MKRFFIFVMFLTFLLGVSGLWAQTIEVWVDDDFTSETEGWELTHFSTIADGINAVDAGGTVNVNPGIYYHTTPITKSVVLKGPNAANNPTSSGTRLDEAIIDGGSTSRFMRIRSDNVKIEGFKIISDSKTAVWINGADLVRNLYIINNIFDGNNEAFATSAAAAGNPNAISNIYFQNNVVKNNTARAISSYVISVTDIEVTGNEFLGQLGVQLAFTNGATISNNKFCLNNPDYWSLLFADDVQNINVISNDFMSARSGISFYQEKEIIGNVVIKDNTFTSIGEDGAVHVRPGVTGIHYITIENNKFPGNILGANNLGIGTLNASLNWWGDNSGPYNESTNEEGSGTPVTDNVIFDPWWQDEEMQNLGSNDYLAGQTYSFTVHAPNSEDGAKASIWGYYVSPAPTPTNPNAVTWKSGTYGSGIFDNGYALVTYTVPEDYKNGREFYWEVKANQSPNSGANTTRFNPYGPWGQFDNYMLNGVTLDIDTYRFEDFRMDRNSASYKAVSLQGPPSEVSEATVYVYQPWFGDISDYVSIYNHNDFVKRNFYPSYAEAHGYVWEKLEENESYPDYQKIHITKPGTDFDLILFGLKTPTNEDESGFMWGTTFHKAALTELTMQYDPSTGISTGVFDEPIPYNTTFCFSPDMYIYDEDEALFYLTRSGGSMDLIFTARQLKPTELYVDVPQELIPGDYTQTYSIKATEMVEKLRTVEFDLMIPRADFVEPNINTDFALGSAYDPYDFTMLMPIVYDDSDDNYHIYKITGMFGGGFDGIIGEDVELITVTLTSVGGGYYNTPEGCYIKIDPDTVILYNDQNGYNSIECAGTTDGWVLIDGEDPKVVIENIDQYPNEMTLQVDGDGVVLPELDLLYTDNYDLATALWVILPSTDDAPTEPGDFPEGNVVGDVDGEETLIEDWELPAEGLADGTYTLYLLVTDEAGNYYILPWTFTIDTVAPTALTWVECRTTPDADISVDLKWNYDADNAPAFINIWVLDYAEIDGLDTNEYPIYNDTDLIVAGTIVNDIDPYQTTSTLGWKMVKQIEVTDELTLNVSEWADMERGYYYFTIYGEADNGQMSDAPADPFYRESISYWPGDVAADLGTVDITDMNVLSDVWGTEKDGDNWNEFCDVGPSTDRARRSRPMPDGKIDIEDLMMFAMNYENTDYHWYPRNEVDAEPVTITLAYQDLGGMLQVSLLLDGNDSFVTGLDIPVAYGSDLILQNIEIGDIWPENSMLLQTNKNGVVTVSCAAFGPGAVIEGNGLVATLNFAVNGYDSGLELQRMTARGWDNSEIDIVGNPTGSVDNEDVVNVIPDSSYLGSAHPNPFRGSATLQYGLKEAGSVRLGVYNTRGQLVRSLLNEGKSAGTYQVNWDGRDENGLRVSSGIYLFRLETTDVIKTQKAMLLK